MPPEFVNLRLAKVFAHKIISFVCLRASMLEYLSSILLHMYQAILITGVSPSIPFLLMEVK